MKTFHEIVQRAKRKYPLGLHALEYNRWKYVTLALNKRNANQYKIQF